MQIVFLFIRKDDLANKTQYIHLAKQNIAHRIIVVFFFTISLISKLKDSLQSYATAMHLKNKTTYI